MYRSTTASGFDETQIVAQTPEATGDRTIRRAGALLSQSIIDVCGWSMLRANRASIVGTDREGVVGD